MLSVVANLSTALKPAPGCLLSQVSVSAADGPQQLEASCALGLLYESQGQPALAMACHERCLQLSQELQRPDDAATAFAQLVQVKHRQQRAPCMQSWEGFRYITPQHAEVFAGVPAEICKQAEEACAVTA
jgi:hypothetical protein